jgi:hypothetical protein
VGSDTRQEDLGAADWDGGSATSDESNRGHCRAAGWAAGAGGTRTGRGEGSDVSVESDVTGLRAAMADGSAKVEEV